MEYQYWSREKLIGEGPDCFMPIIPHVDGKHEVVTGMNYLMWLDELLDAYPDTKAVLDYETGEPVYISNEHREEIERA